MKMVSETKMQIYDDDSVLIGYPPHEKITTITESNFDIYKIAPSTTDKNIPLVNATCEILIVYTDNAISIKVNGSVTAFTITDEFKIIGSGITSLSITNASTEDTATIQVLAGNV
jgi:hypothetical protein